MKVKWTNRARIDLRMLFEYYREKATPAVANRIVTHIVKRSLELERFPLLGEKDQSLEGMEVEYRSLIAGNQKLIYWIKDEEIFVATLFDCRQEPEKLKRRLE